MERNKPYKIYLKVFSVFGKVHIYIHNCTKSSCENIVYVLSLEVHIRTHACTCVLVIVHKVHLFYWLPVQVCK